MRVRVLFALALIALLSATSRTSDDFGVPGRDGLVVCTSAPTCFESVADDSIGVRCSRSPMRSRAR